MYDEISGSVITGVYKHYVNFKGQRFWHRLRIENNLQNWRWQKSLLQNTAAILVEIESNTKLF